MRGGLHGAGLALGVPERGLPALGALAFANRIALARVPVLVPGEPNASVLVEFRFPLRAGPSIARENEVPIGGLK